MVRLRRPAVAVLLLATFCPTLAFGQQPKAGIVTNLEGRATATRVVLPEPVALKFKDDVFLNDQITTAERSLARMLLGGKAVVTVRERSTLTITEVPGLSTVELPAGKLAIAVARERLAPGETIQIRTPNAITAVRGTALVVEVIRTIPDPARIDPDATTNVGVFTGSAEILHIDPRTGAPLAAPMTVALREKFVARGLQQAIVAAFGPGDEARFQEGVTPKEFQHVDPANKEQLVAEAQETAEGLLGAFVVGSFGPTVEPLPVDFRPPILPGNETLTPLPTGTGFPSNITIAPELSAFTIPLGSAADPVLQINGVSVAVAGDAVTVDSSTPTPPTLTRPLMEVVNSSLVIAGSLLRVEGTLSSTGPAPLIQIDPTTISTGTVTTYDSPPGPGVVPVDGLTFNGVTYSFSIDGEPSSDATFGSTGPGIIQFVQDPSLEGDALGELTLSLASPAPGIRFGLARDSFESLLPGAQVTLRAADGTVIGTFDLDTLSLIESFSEGLFTYTGTPVSTAVITFPFTDPEGFPFAARFALDNLGILGSLITLAGPVANLEVAGGLLQASGLTLTNTATLLSLDNGAKLKAGGPLADLVDSSLNLGAIAVLSRGSSIETTAGPVIRMSGGSLTADALAISDGAGNIFKLTGTVLDLTNAVVQLRTIGAEPDESTDEVTFSLGVNQPLIRLSSSALTLTGEGEELVSFDADSESLVPQGGVAVIATGSSDAPSTIAVAGVLLELSGVELTDPNPQIQLTHTTVTQTSPGESFSEFIEAFDLPVTVRGPLLAAANSTLNIDFDVIGANDLTSTGAGALITLQDSSLTSTDGGVLAAFIAQLAGPLLTAVDSPIALGFDVVSVGALTSSGVAPLIALSSSPLTVAGALLGPGTVELAGSLLDALNSRVTVGDDVVEVGLLTSTGASPMISLQGRALSSDFNLLRGAGSVVLVDEGAIATILLPGSATLRGSLLSAISLDDEEVVLGGAIASLGSLATTGTAASLVSLQSAPLTAAGGIVGNFVTLSGPVLAATGSAVTLGGPVLSIADLTSTGTAALVSLQSSPLDAGGVLDINRGLTGTGTVFRAPTVRQATLAGPLLTATNSAVTLTTDAIRVAVGATLTSATDQPFVELVGTSSLTVTGSGLLTLPGAGTAATFAGPVLSLLSGTPTVSVAGDLLSITGGSVLESTADGIPLIDVAATGIAGVSIAGALAAVTGTNSTLTLAGSLLRMAAADGVLDVDGRLLLVDAGGAVEMAGSAAFIHLTDGSQSFAGGLAHVMDSFISIGGSFVSKTLSAVDFLLVDDASLTLDDGFPLVELNPSDVAIGGAFARLVNGATLTMQGGLLREIDSTLAVGGDVLNVSNGARLVANPTEGFYALVSLSGGSLTVGSAAAPAHMFNLVGRPDNSELDPDPDPVTGAGTGLTIGLDEPVQHAGRRAFLETSLGDFEDAPAVGVSGSVARIENSRVVDIQLLEATLPAIANLTGGTNLTTGSHAVDLGPNAKLELQDLIRLSNSTMTVLNGHLVNVNASSFNANTVAALRGGATLDILNGVILNLTNGGVANLASLVNFTGTVNVINVTNSFAPNLFISGIPIHVANGATFNHAISETPIVGLGTAGTINLRASGTTTFTPLQSGATSAPASLVAIQGTGGTLKIGAGTSGGGGLTP